MKGLKHLCPVGYKTEMPIFSSSKVSSNLQTLLPLFSGSFLFLVVQPCDELARS